MAITQRCLSDILLVEDNEDDVYLTRRGFERAKLMATLHHVANGCECMAFLRREGKYRDAPVPDLILLDLNMPRMDGRQVMEAITKDEGLRQLPVVILTTSKSEADLLEMYKLRCSTYVPKPIDFDHFESVIETIQNYWLNVAALPPKL